MTTLIKSIFGSRIGSFYDFAYWAVKLRNPEQWISEVDGRVNFLVAAFNPYNWRTDVIRTGDILRIEQLWLFCPKTPQYPQGGTAMLKFSQADSGTAFLLNVTKRSAHKGITTHKIIGKVTDRATGACECCIWDETFHTLVYPFYTDVNNFSSWRDGIGPIGQLSHQQIGLRL